MTSIRRTGAASGATLSALAVALGLAHAVAPKWSEQVGLDVWNYSAAQNRVRDAESQSDSIRVGRDKLLREIEMADHLASQMIDGKLTLAAAVDELEPTLRNRPGFDVVRECHYKTPTFRHAVARYALTHIGIVLQSDPDRLAAVTPRLEAEYSALR